MELDGKSASGEESSRSTLGRVQMQMRSEVTGGHISWGAGEI